MEAVSYSYARRRKMKLPGTSNPFRYSYIKKGETYVLEAARYTKLEDFLEKYHPDMHIVYLKRKHCTLHAHSLSDQLMHTINWSSTGIDPIHWHDLYFLLREQGL